MSSQTQTTQLATSQTLTGSYAATNTLGTFTISGETSAVLDFKYTTGSGETTAYLNYTIEFSPDNGTTWIQETYQSVTSGVSTEAPLSHKVAGGAGSTSYPAQYGLPLCDGIIRVKVKETSVSSNFGTLNVWLNVNAAGTNVRNILPPVAGSGGTTDVNLTQVGGASVSLGQKTMANSIPVVLASDESALSITGTVTANAGTNLNTSALALESGGNLAAIAASASVLDDWDESDRAKVNPIVGQAGVQGGSGTVSNTTQRVVLATDVALPAGTNAIGKLSPNSGVDIGDVDVTSIAAGTNYIGKVRLTDGTLDSSLVDETGASAVDALAVGGATPHDSADSGNPMKIGGKALTAQPTAVTANDRVNAEFDVYGRQITMNALREMKGNQITTITASTAETTIVTADATYKLDLYGIIVVNTSATATEIAVKDSTAGTTRFWISIPANDMRGFMLPMDAGHVQSAANNNWTATCQDSVSSIVVTALFVKNL